jgi:predicted Rossmann fold nucleotide-binding protein DprA/Smf involved in DNA uptake
MNNELSANTQAILLLTAPLIAGRSDDSAELLTPGEYKKLARLLVEKQRQPEDLLSLDADSIMKECQTVVDAARLKRLLDRGFLLSQAVEKWRSRAIWVVSRADATYPRRLKKNLRENAPPLLYGCGDAALLDKGGLAVVGSRNVNDELVEYTERIGRLAAEAGKIIVSGGARGIDQAAMRGSLDSDGKVIGVLADKLESAAMNRDNRNMLMHGQLVLISPYDPAAGFNVGNAMQRNKLIYALADVALVVSSDLNKGGTWAGAVEQLEKYKIAPVYVRSGSKGSGLEALRKKGALHWPDPQSTYALKEMLERSVTVRVQEQEELLLAVHEKTDREYAVPVKERLVKPKSTPYVSIEPDNSSNELFATVRKLLRQMPMPKTAEDVSADLDIPTSLAKKWLDRLVQEAVLKKLKKPVRYQVAQTMSGLFDTKPDV